MTQNTQQIAKLRTHLILPFRLWHDDKQPQPGNPFEHARKKLAASIWQPAHPLSPDHPLEQASLQDYQAYSYFHPFVRRFWYSDQHVCRFKRQDIRALKITLSGANAPADPIQLNVNQCELILFNVAYVAILHLSLESCSETAPLTLKEVQLLSSQFRRIYPPYLDGYEENPEEAHVPIWRAGHHPRRIEFIYGEGAAPETVTPSETHPSHAIHSVRAAVNEALRYRPKNRGDTPLSYLWDTHWKKLLEPVFSTQPPVQGTTNLFAVQLGDDRAGICNHIAFDVPKENMRNLIDRGNWVRMCFAEEAGHDKLPYSERSLENFEDDYCYDRWWYNEDESDEAPSRILNCGYAFTWAGSKADTRYFTNTRNGAAMIFEHIYVPMALIAHFQRSALLAASSRLAELSSQGFNNERVKKEFEIFYGAFLRFTQTYWFEEITPQQQGIELFEMWRKHLRIQQLYDEAHNELHDVVEYFDMLEAQKETKNANRLNWIVMVLGSIGMFAGLFSMIQLGPENIQGTTPGHNLWPDYINRLFSQIHVSPTPDTIKNWLWYAFFFLMIFSVLLTAAVTLGLALRYFLSWNRSRRA